MTVNFLEMKFDGTKYKDKNGFVWELDGIEDDFCTYIGEYFTVLGTHYTQKQLVGMEFEECVDWYKLPIDTKILVWSELNKQKHPRHFAGVDSATGRVKAWDGGRTSFTTKITSETSDWDYAELYKEEERAEE